MDPSISSRRRRIGVSVAGSVWETRMQSDDAIVKAIHLQPLDEDNNSNKQMSLKEVNGKRRNWKSDAKSALVEIDRANSLKLTRPRSIGATPPVTPRRSIGSTPPVTPRRSMSSDSNDKSLIVSVAAKKARSEYVEGIEKTRGRVKKSRSEMFTEIVKSGEFDSVALRKVNSLPARSNSEKSNKKTEHVDVPSVSELPEESKEEETVNEKPKIPEEVKEFGVYEEIIISCNSNENEQIENDDHEEEGEEEEEEKVEEVEKKNIDVKVMDVTKKDNNNRVSGVEINKKYSQFHDRTAPSPSSVRKIPPPVIKRATSVYSVPPSTERFAEEAHNFTQSQSKLQSLVDLVMWRDVSRSTLVFGFGTFLIISSSYANDLNFSFISVVAYIGLIYLGVMFVFKSVIHRGMVEEEMHKEVGVREEEVKRMLRLIMPYLNESLFQLRALFSGDPSTTLKMGLVLFVLARCGSSITLWNLAKFGFLGAFTVPRIFISYSNHFSAYGEFWVRRFRDAWESCSHKKAVALALFTLVWNLSSVIARVWAAFMLFVALRYYQHKMVWTKDQDEDDVDDDDDEHVVEDVEEEEQVPKPKRSPYMMMPNKLKKIS